MVFMCIVFTRTEGGVNLGDLGLCCCVPRLSSAINLRRLLSLSSDLNGLFCRVFLAV